MTVQDTTPQVTFVGTGAQVSFPFTFRADDIAWLSVDYLVNFDQFTINADQDNNPGGTVEYTVAPPLAQELTVIRATPNVQLLDYNRYDPFDSESHEDALDRLTMQIQDLDNYIQQTLTQSLSLLDDVNDATKVDGSFLYWNDGAMEWQDTAANMTFTGGNLFTFNQSALFNFQVNIDNRLQIQAGNDIEFRSGAGTNWIQMSTSAANGEILSDGTVANFVFSNFSGRIMQGGQTLAYVSELPVVISDHTLLTNIGVNTHVQIDAHIADATIHFTEASIDHANLIGTAGTFSHGIIDSHINNGTIHYQQSAIDHVNIMSIGVNTHAQIDSHIADLNIHFPDAPSDGSTYGRNNGAWAIAAGGGVTDHFLLTNIGVNTHVQIDTHIADATIHFTEGSIDHTAISNIGVNTHAAIDTHIADGTIHFTEASIDHTAILNIGVNSHAAIDTHIADATIHFTEGSIDHGSIAGLADDDHSQYLFLAGRAGGQTAFGGTAASENLILQGSSAANRGRVIARGGIDVEWDWTTDQITAGGIRFANVVPASGGVINASIFIQNNVTVNNALFIQSALDDNSTLTWTTAPGFAVTTLFFARQVYRSTTPAVPPAQTFVYAAQCSYDIQGAGAITVGNYRALSFAPIIRVRNAGDNLTITNVNGVTVGPLWNTNNATAIADFGTIRGVHMLNPGQALFGQSLGTERCANIVGLDMNNMTLTTSGVRAAVRSSLTNNAQNYVIQNLGGADSDFGAGDIEFNDSAGVKFGDSNDVFLFYNSAQAALTFSSFFGVTSNPLYLRPDAVDVWAFQQDNGGSLDIGLQFNVNAISFGTTTPTPNSNNWFIQFAAPNQRQVQIGGEYSDVLWTAGGSIDVDGQTVSNLQAFKINSPAVILNGGTIDDISNLFVEAMPSFGATRVQALRVLGRARIDGHQNYGARSPAQITANQNDYQLGANNAQRTMNLLDSDAAYNITGIDSSFGRAQDGDAVCLYNTGSFNLTLTHQDALSTAANRMISPTGVSYVIGPNECVWIYYDLVVARWRLLEGTGA